MNSEGKYYGGKAVKDKKIRRVGPGEEGGGRKRTPNAQPVTLNLQKIGERHDLDAVDTIAVYLVQDNQRFGVVVVDGQ